MLDGALEMPEEHLGLVAEGLDLVCVPPEAGMVLRTDGLAILCGRSKDVGQLAGMSWSLEAWNQ